MCHHIWRNVMRSGAGDVWRGDVWRKSNMTSDSNSVTTITYVPMPIWSLIAVFHKIFSSIPPPPPNLYVSSHWSAVRGALPADKNYSVERLIWMLRTYQPFLWILELPFSCIKPLRHGPKVHREYWDEHNIGLKHSRRANRGNQIFELSVFGPKWPVFVFPNRKTAGFGL